MQSTLYGETKKALRETCITCVFELLSYQNNSLYEETEQHYQKTCILSVFEIRTKNDKTHAKHSLWMNINITTNVYFQCTPLGVFLRNNVEKRQEA